MQILFVQHKFEEKFPLCRTARNPETQGYWHDSLCCKKELIRYFDSTTDDEVALIVEYTYVDPAKGVRRIIHRLRIDNDIYDLRLL
jgi:hypothetical protein